MPKGIYPNNNGGRGVKRPPRSLQWKIKQRIAHLGKKPSIETRLKMSESRKGRKSWNKGIPMPEERKKIFSQYNKGRKFSDEHRKKISEAQKNLFKSQDYRKRVGVKRRGEKHWNWKGGLTDIRHKIRNSLEYKLWRTSVFERDNYTCVWCKQKGGKLEVDHIKPFAIFPELRFAIDNGRTLCVACHRKTDTWGNYRKSELSLINNL